MVAALVNFSPASHKGAVEKVIRTPFEVERIAMNAVEDWVEKNQVAISQQAATETTRALETLGKRSPK
mgnify:CR=1 FL=1